MTASARPGSRADTRQPPAGAPAPTARPLALTGALGACAVVAVGLVVIIPLVLVGWIAAPHAGLGLPGVLRTATAIWLAAHHVGFTLRGAGRIGMLPLGLTLLPGALLWRAGRWVVRSGRVRRLSHVGYAAVALAGPYAVLCGALALAGRSPIVTPSLPQAVVAGFLLALCAGGLGAARALAPWGALARLMPPRPRSLVLSTAGALVVLGAAGALLAAVSLAIHIGEFATLSAALGAGAVGSALLLLAQMAYLPNAVGWAVCFTLGPGFAFGTGTVVAPAGVALGPLPALPMLAALPAGAHGAVPGWASAAVLVVPYLAGSFGGLLLARAGPVCSLEVAPLWGFACGAATGLVTGVLAAFSGGPLGSGRLAAVGPSGWQSGLVAALEVGVSAAIVAGVINWRRLRREAVPAGAPGPVARGGAAVDSLAGDDDSGHRIFVDPWADAEEETPPAQPPGPAALP